MQTHSTFDTRKSQILDQIINNDRSVKQSIDTHALPLVELINGLDDFVTTSSCSGRSSIIVSNPKKDQQLEKGSAWLFISHDLVSVDNEKFYYELTDLFPSHCHEGALPADLDDSRMIYFKFEPFIVHIEARDLPAGQRLLSCALQAGYRNSGLVLSASDRVMVGVRHTMKLDVPIGLVDDCGQNQLIVSMEYLIFLFKTANMKLQQNFDRMLILLTKVEHEFCSGPNNDNQISQIREDKEQRRQRKREEGLLKQKEKHATINEPANDDNVDIAIDFV